MQTKTDTSSQPNRPAPEPSRPLSRGRLAAIVGARNRSFLAAVAFLAVLLLTFMIMAPDVFLSSRIYAAVFSSSLPLIVILVVPIVFVIVSGEIDLSFPSVVGVAALAFAMAVDAGLNPFVALLLGCLAGVVIGMVNGVLIAYLGLPSLVVTLGMLFLLRGVVLVLSGGTAIPLGPLRDTTFATAFVGRLGWLPKPMVWAMLLGLAGVVVFGWHKFGAHVRAIGDNSATADQMGINVRRTKLTAFCYLGASCGVAGAMAVSINATFYPTTGDAYLLLVLAAVFVGGTPVWGGTGTAAGAIVGATTVGFIEAGIVAVGLTGNFTQLFYGLVIILSLVTHRLAGRRALSR